LLAKLIVIFPSTHPSLTSENLNFKKVSADDLAELEQIVSYRLKKDLTATQMLEMLNSHFEDKYAINWGMYIDNELIGTIGFYRGFKDNIAEIGYVTREKFRSKGYTSKGIQRIIEYGLSEMKLDGIVAYTSKENEISIAVLGKLNFVQIESEKEEYTKYKLVIA
jgi:RimJ/RimL family protein N-acetyltransferase